MHLDRLYDGLGAGRQYGHLLVPAHRPRLDAAEGDRADAPYVKAVVDRDARGARARALPFPARAERPERVGRLAQPVGPRPGVPLEDGPADELFEAPLVDAVRVAQHAAAHAEHVERDGLLAGEPVERRDVEHGVLGHADGLEQRLYPVRKAARRDVRAQDAAALAVVQHEVACGAPFSELRRDGLVAEDGRIHRVRAAARARGNLTVSGG